MLELSEDHEARMVRYFQILSSIKWPSLLLRTLLHQRSIIEDTQVRVFPDQSRVDTRSAKLQYS